MDNIVSLDEFKESPEGQYDRWTSELDAAKLTKFHKRAKASVDKFTNEKNEDSFKLNLYHSNIKTMQSMMFGQTPEIKFSRTNTDFNDDVARVAGMMLERMLNADIGTPDDQYSQALKHNLQDRLLAGLGVSRVRYTFDEEEVTPEPIIDPMTGAEAPQDAYQKIVNERAPIDYVNWKDLGWSPCKVWEEVRWLSFDTTMTRDEAAKRFGEDVAKKLPMDTKGLKPDSDPNSPAHDSWQRIKITEIWDKDSLTVVWYCKGYEKILDTKPDPLGLTGFWPIPEPMASNITTSAYMPVPDYFMAQDLYNEVDSLERRIHKITEAVKVVGVYDASAEGVKRMMEEGVENDLIPVDSWAAFAEKGGIAGQIDWMPIVEIAGVLEKLVVRRDDAKALLYEVNGMSDIMRGNAQAAGGPVSATERSLEARFASVRIQAMQDEFARFATDLIRLRAEVVSKHFQPETIAQQSNIENTVDAQLAQPAIELIKNDRTLIWRIAVKSESVAMVDFAQLKEERTAYINALSMFMQSAGPLVEQDPTTLPFLLEMLKWGLAGFKGSSEVEGILDQAIKGMQAQGGEQEQEQPSDAQIKAQMEQQKQQFEMQKMEMQAQIEDKKGQAEAQQSHHAHEMRIAEIQANTAADLQKEQAQAQLNILEEQNETEESNKREAFKHELALELLRANTAATQATQVKAPE